MSQCDDAQRIADSVFLKSVLLFKVFCSIVGVIAPVFIWYKLGIRWLCHPNAKVLYSIHLLWAIQVPLFSIAVFLYDFLRLSRKVSDPCDLMISIGFCMATKMTTIVGIVAQETSMLAFAVERAFSTLYPAKYEKMKSRSLSIFLTIFSVILAAIVKYGFMLPGLDFNELTPTYSVLFLGNIGYFQTSLYLEMTIEISTGIIFAAAFVRSRQLQKKHVYDMSILGMKYQLTENQRLIVLLFPLFVLHFVINVFTVAILAVYPYFYAEDPLTRLAWTEFWSTPYLYAILLPLLIWRRLRKEEERRRSEPSGFVQSEQEHFNALAVIFKKD